MTICFVAGKSKFLCRLEVDDVCRTSRTCQTRQTGLTRPTSLIVIAGYCFDFLRITLSARFLFKRYAKITKLADIGKFRVHFLLLYVIVCYWRRRRVTVELSPEGTVAQSE